VFINPVLTALQLDPLLVERNTPPAYVPAKRFVPLTTRDQTRVVVKPELTAVQLDPLLVERSTPLPVPAKRFVPLIAKSYIEEFGNPVLI
jgi:hypothetical protein